MVENRGGGERDHIAVTNLAPRDVLAKAVDALVHFGHEFVEMGAAFVLDRALLKKHIHQHGLATPDLTVDVEAARRHVVVVGKQPVEQALLAQRLVARKPLLKVGECLGGLRLRSIGLDRAGGDEGLIMAAERGGRGRQHGPCYGPSARKLQAGNWCKGRCGCGALGGTAPPHKGSSSPRKAGIQYAAASRF